MTIRTLFAASLAVITLFMCGAARAEVEELRISQQFGIGYLPLYIARHQGLFEKHAKELGLPNLKVSFITLSGGASTADALLSDSIDIATGGVGAFLPIWAKTKGNLDVKGIAAVSTLPIALITTNPAVKSVRDFGPKDRIALPSVKSSVQSALLELATEKEFGQGQAGRLDDLTVSMKHPDAYVALASGKSEVTAHFGSPPFQQRELLLQGAHKVVDSFQILGGPVTFNVAWAKSSFRERNPKVYRAFLDALREADTFITANPSEAAKIAVAEDKDIPDADLVLRIITEPGAEFSLTPRNTFRLAEFLYRTGNIVAQPSDWKGLYFLDIHDQEGS